MDGDMEAADRQDSARGKAEAIAGGRGQMLEALYIAWSNVAICQMSVVSAGQG